MKSIFLKKHFLLFTLSLFFSNILVECSINTSATDPYNKKDSSISQVEKKVIFLKNTAVFIGDGTKAAFYGKEYTLNFTFPNNHNALPIATDMKISGFEPLEGKTYVNNGIPVHEFG